MKPERTIAILFRKDENLRNVEGYAIHGMMEYWRHCGITVLPVFGPSRKKIAADLLLIHVNLSVVPQDYLDYAEQYPVILNASIVDIRKTAVCGHLVRGGDGYRGPVIVKSDLNAAGIPEKKARLKISRKMEIFFQWLAPPAMIIHKQEDYCIYPSVDEMPVGIFDDDKLVVQKFLPEKEDGIYHVRSYSFLGDRFSCMCLSSREPIIHLRNTEDIEAVAPHPDIVALRHKLRMDYGKIDYTLHNGRAVLLDVNKTTGVRRNESDPVVLAMRKERAKGIFPYLGLQAPDD